MELQHVAIDIQATQYETSLAAQTLMLSLEAFPLHHLLVARMWAVEDSVSYEVCRDQGGDIVPDESSVALQPLLEDLLAGTADAGGPDWLASSMKDPSRADLLEAFEGAGLVKVADNKVVVTSLGHQCFRPCSVLRTPTYLAAKREGVALADMTVWELIVRLDMDQFVHAVKKPDKRDKPFDPSDPESRYWYSGPGSTTVARGYLHALADGSLIVHHWHTNGYYEALLAGEDYIPKKRTPKHYQFKQQREDDWDAGMEDEPPIADKPKKPRACRRQGRW